jgi:hypothetical protein
VCVALPKIFAGGCYSSPKVLLIRAQVDLPARRSPVLVEREKRATWLTELAELLDAAILRLLPPDH